MKKKRILSFLLCGTMIVSLCACGKKELQGNSVNSLPSNNGISSTNNTNTTNNQLASSLKAEDFISKLKMNFSSASVEQSVDYGSPIFAIGETEELRFPVNENLRYRGYDIFEVYGNADLDFSNRIYLDMDYENGTMILKPKSSYSLTENGAIYVDNTWGSYNRLYLVQKLDLQSGQVLDKPIVTPFTVKHALDAPVVTQRVNEKNTYTLSWEPVSGATKYVVYSSVGQDNFTVEAVTTNTTINSDEFNSQKHSDSFMDLVNKDLGVSEPISLYMNSGVRRAFERGEGGYVVVAFNGSQSSGRSNFVALKEIANRLPYTIHKNDEVNLWEVVNASNIMELPSHIEIEMIDGSYQKFVINYHGGKIHQFEGYSVIEAYVYNTSFSRFRMKVVGLDYDEMTEKIYQVVDRQDNLIVATPNSEIDGSFVLPEAPSNDRNTENRPVEEEINTGMGEIEPVYVVEEPTVEKPPQIVEEPIVDPVENPPEVVNSNSPVNPEPSTNTGSNGFVYDESKIVMTPQGFSTLDLMLEEAMMVQSRISQLPYIEEVLFARNDLQSWLAYCLISNLEVITVPQCVFSEGANLDYVVELFTEAYRQNPTSGVVLDIGYSYDYESIYVKYAESPEIRLNRAISELQKAKEVSSMLTGGNEYDRIVAINNYLCDNASYDNDSTSTNLDESNLTQAFIDAHTPYGILCNNYGVCESYAESMILVGRMMGLDVRAIFGTLSGGPHEWNKVKIGSEWYIVDITNNDLDLFPNSLLNVTDSQTSGLLAESPEANLESMPATDTSYEYYYRNNLSFSDKESAVNAFVNAFSSGKNMFSVRVPNYFTENDCVYIGQSVGNKLGRDGGFGLFNGVLSIQLS